jgi:hypothetical protein
LQDGRVSYSEKVAAGVCCAWRADDTGDLTLRTHSKGADPMKNPWLSHNPFLSLWLQATNTAFGAARGYALNEARRQHRMMMEESARAAMAFWSQSPTSPRRRTKRQKR